MRKSTRERTTTTSLSQPHAIEKANQLKNNRRGVVSRITRLLNTILSITSLDKYHDVEGYYKDVLINLAKLKIINNEYLIYETEDKIRKSMDLLDREEVRIAEIRKTIDAYARKFKYSPSKPIPTSLLDLSENQNLNTPLSSRSWISHIQKRTAQ